jgi:hypothetical protein
MTQAGTAIAFRIIRRASTTSAYEELEVPMHVVSDMMDDHDDLVPATDSAFSDLHGISAGGAELPVMTWRSDLLGRREWLSEAWGVFTGRALRSCGSHFDWTDCLHAEDRERCAGIFQTCAVSGTPFTMDYRLRRMDGTYRWVMESGVPQHVDGVLTGFFGTCVDVHARRLSGDRLAERTRALRLQERRRESQLAALAHELRGPVGLMADAQRLLSESVEDAPIESRIESLNAMLKRAQDQLAHAIAEVETIAGRTPGAVTGLCLVPVPIVEVLNLATRFLDSTMTHSGHRLGLDMPEPGTLLCADAVQLGHAIAIVVERVCDCFESPIKVGLTIRHHENALFLRVRRSQEAVEPNFVPRAFELARQRSQRTGDDDRPLAGTKLDFARRIVRLHCGDLFASPPGAAMPTEWVMRVPLRRGHDAARPAAA